MKTWYIYKITNLLTDRSYVGQHLKRNKKEPLNDGYMGSGIYIKKSIKKYGKHNFKKEILKDNIHCQTAANIFEEIYIKKENTLHPGGYNFKTASSMSGNGNNTKGHKLSEEHKKKISQNHKGGYKKGDKISEDVREKISLANKGQIAWNTGKKASEETKLKMSKARKGKPNIKNKGSKRSEEAKLKMSLAAKARWNKITNFKWN